MLKTGTHTGRAGQLYSLSSLHTHCLPKKNLHGKRICLSPLPLPHASQPLPANTGTDPQLQKHPIAASAVKSQPPLSKPRGPKQDPSCTPGVQLPPLVPQSGWMPLEREKLSKILPCIPLGRYLALKKVNLQLSLAIPSSCCQLAAKCSHTTREGTWLCFWRWFAKV